MSTKRGSIKKRGLTIEGQFIGHRRDLLESPVWRALSIAERRLLDRLELEILRNGGNRANGSLEVSYGQFYASGVRKDGIRPALDMVTAFGLLVTIERGRGGNAEHRKGSKYRLTYLPAPIPGGVEIYGPTDQWRLIEASDVKRILAEMKKAAATQKAAATAARKAAKTSLGPTPRNGGDPPLTMRGGLSSFPPLTVRGSNGNSRPSRRGVSSISPGGASTLPPAPPLSSVPKANGRRPKASRSETFHGPPAQGDLNPTFANPGWCDGLVHTNGACVAPAPGARRPTPPPARKTPKNAVAMTAEDRRARQREYNRRHRAKMTDEERAAALAKNREYQRRHVAKKAAMPPA
jgi:hypothetical protein